MICIFHFKIYRQLVFHSTQIVSMHLSKIKGYENTTMYKIIAETVVNSGVVARFNFRVT